MAAEGVAAQQRLTKTDRTTTKIPVSNGVVIRSERRRQTAGCHYSTSEKGPRERHHQWELKVGNRNISSLGGKEEQLVDEAIKYQLDIVGFSSTKRLGSGLLNLNGRKLFYSGVDFTRGPAGVLVELNVAHRINDWKPLSGRMAILRPKLQEAEAMT
ncbi:unnamed protein product [Soboliphyme baturini]|uniref:Uncharacterized protein n=1 Tax=Soboliphyme baturini TaxID=241478 RepID=A0A3P8E7Q5_9BILA|nr:unnamed protein product [Soboliphyme baturini]